jgi:hypothetical protein
MGACQLDPGAPWDLICVSATVAATKPTGAQWDPSTSTVSPLPDPFCELTIDGNRAATTATMLNTLSPQWDQSIAPANMDLTTMFLTMKAGSWAVAVLDDDANQTSFDPICSVSPTLTPADFAAGTLQLPPTQSCLSLSIQLVCAQ